MVDIIFNCPKCHAKLAVESSGAGLQVNCPECQGIITIPAAVVPEIRQPERASPIPSSCRTCGATSSQGARFCQKCGVTLTANSETRVHEPKGGFSYFPPPGWDCEISAKDGFKKWTTSGTYGHPSCDFGVVPVDMSIFSFDKESAKAILASNNMAIRNGTKLQVISSSSVSTAIGHKGKKIVMGMKFGEIPCLQFIYMFLGTGKLITMVCFSSAKDAEGVAPIFDNIAESIQTND